jgi:hypothetical protein
MRNILFATVAVLGLATAIPAFADQGDGADRADSANSLPPGFYNGTPFGIHANIVEQHFANKGEESWQAQRGITPVLQPQAQAQAQAKPLNHVDILSYMLGHPVKKPG